MPKQVLVFGGSFNPPHLGHRQVVACLSGLAGFDEVWVIPVFAHPFDKDLAPFEYRFQMAELAFRACGPKVKILPIEKEIGFSPSYTIDVIRELQKRHPDYEFTLALGSDCRVDLSSWKESETLQKLVKFHFFPRPGLEASIFMDISSSQLREKLGQGEDVAAWLAPQVLNYIRQKNLYHDQAI